MNQNNHGPPKILLTGKGGKSGSWAIRGLQLGEALGAAVKPLATEADCMAADVVVVVKRVPTDVLRNVVKAGRPWVYDIVDSWPQPTGNAWSKTQSIAWLRGEIARLKPSAMVFGTYQMQADAAFEGPSIIVRHHAWPKYDRIKVRHKIMAVGYEGSEAYLGRWRSIIQAECNDRGWSFVINGDMSRCDVGVAVRDVEGYPAKAWKPGTKLSNLQALGLPALLSDEIGYREQASGTEYWIEHPDDIGNAFDALKTPEFRSMISLRQQVAAPRLCDVAKDYAAWLSTLKF